MLLLLLPLLLLILNPTLWNEDIGVADPCSDQ